MVLDKNISDIFEQIDLWPLNFVLDIGALFILTFWEVFKKRF